MGDNHDGPIEQLHGKIDSLSGKVDLINQQLIELRVKVELQNEALKDAPVRLAKLEVQYLIVWALLSAILLGIVARALKWL